MDHYLQLLSRLTAPKPIDVINRLERKVPGSKPPPRRLFIKSGIQPVDLYCYLYARFGPPNGIQTLLRADDSHNMFHWHYSLWDGDLGIELMAGTYKIEVWYPEEFCHSQDPLVDFVAAIVADSSNFAADAKEIKSKLERWLVFANPFLRLHVGLVRMLERADELLKLTQNPPKHPETAEESATFGKLFQPIANASHEAFSLCRAVRMLLPVLAETFVNLLLFLLCRPEIKSDSRLYESVKRTAIDVRIKSLNINCIGFASQVDFTTEVCKRVNTMFNNRNNLLHGNINPKAEHHEVVYFDGTVPLFTEWLDFYQRTFGAQLSSNDHASATSELTDIMAFVDEVIQVLMPAVQLEVRKILEFAELGYNPQTKRIGLLFPNILTDYIFEFEQKPTQGEGENEKPKGIHPQD